MFKTLGGLCVAMAGSAALLGWMEPESSFSVADTDPKVARRNVALAAAWHPTAKPAEWKFIRIVADTVEVKARVPGSESVDADHHFVVSTRGIVRASDTWKRQSPCAQHHSSIVVTIEIAPSGPGMPIAQWLGLRLLLAELLGNDHAADRGLSLRIDESIDRDYSDLAGSLRRCLLGEGFKPADG